jgi:uncharacterized protein YcfL
VRKTWLTFIAVSIGVLLVASCAKHNPVAPSQAPSQGKMLFTLEAADNVVSGKVTISKGAITQDLPISITNHTGTVNFDGIQVGTWQILVQLFDSSGVEIYTGNGTALVTLNATTTVTIRVNHNTGNLQVIVQVPGLMVFWNKMGSMAELQNSEVGPGFDHIQGIKEFSPVKYGNGVEFDYSYACGAHVLNPAKLGNMKAGAMEFWYLSNTEKPDREAMYLCGINDPNYSQCGISVGLYRDAGYNGAVGLCLSGYEKTNYFRIQTGTVGNANITFSTTEPTHLAFVWDRDGIAGSADTLRIYRDGVLLLAGQPRFDGWNDAVTDFVIWGEGDYRPGWATAPNGKMDNLKIWNYPKTDFSDRFVE